MGAGRFYVPFVEKVTYTPAEFAEVFGRERTWGYRQLYKGKVNAITELGRTLIPKSEVDRLLKEAGRYLGAKAKTAKVESPTVEKPDKKASSQTWREAVKRRKEGAADKKESGSKKQMPTDKGNTQSVEEEAPRRAVGLKKFGRGSR